MKNEAALASIWILITGNETFLASLAEARQPWPEEDRAPLLWTDDFSNLFQVLR